MKMSAATSPTKPAAISSIVSMKPSMYLRIRGALRVTQRTNSPSSWPGQILGQARPSTSWPSNKTWMPGTRPGMTTKFRSADSTSIRGVVLRQRVLELFHRRVGIGAYPLHLGGPARLQRLGCLAPRLELGGTDRVDLVPLLLAQLVAAGKL